MVKLDKHQFKHLVPIESLPTRSQRELIKQMQIKTVKKGKKVFCRGDTDDDFVYLQNGRLCLTDKNHHEITIDAEHKDALSPLSNLKPRRYTATVTSSHAVILRFPGTIMENLLAMGEAPSQPEESVDLIEIYEFKTPDDQSWMMALLGTNAFRHLSVANISRLFNSFEEFSLKAGEKVFNYGDIGKYYYIVRSGSCKVWRPTDTGKIVLAELSECESFGEEALISSRPRNATVEMISDGSLMRLSKKSFTTLLKNPLVNLVNMKQTKSLVKKGAFKVDVRTENEYLRSGIKGSINIPLHMVRSKAQILDPEKKYVLFCNNGTRSEAAAFIMAGMGLDVFVVKGGLNALIAVREKRQARKMQSK